VVAGWWDDHLWDASGCIVVVGRYVTAHGALGLGMHLGC